MLFSVPTLTLNSGVEKRYYETVTLTQSTHRPLTVALVSFCECMSECVDDIGVCSRLAAGKRLVVGSMNRPEKGPVSVHFHPNSNGVSLVTE